MNIALFNTWI